MFVESAVKRDIKTFTEKADDIIASRIDGIVAEMRKVIGSKLFSEEVVNELSKKTLGSYIKKAADDSAHLASRAISKANYSKTDTGYDDSRKSYKRRQGIAKATDKLTKEDEDLEEDEVNELSKKTLASYAHKSGDELQRHAYSAGYKSTKSLRLSDRKVDNRLAGYNKAVAKLKEEETVDEDEEVNELSKKTLGSYVTKASRDVLAKSAAGGVGIGGSNHKNRLDGAKLINKAGRRTNSIATAADKLTKEETVDEASPMIISKANKNAALQKNRLNKRLKATQRADNEREKKEVK